LKNPQSAESSEADLELRTFGFDTVRAASQLWTTNILVETVSVIFLTCLPVSRCPACSCGAWFARFRPASVRDNAGPGPDPIFLGGERLTGSRTGTLPDCLSMPERSGNLFFRGEILRELL